MSEKESNKAVSLRGGVWPLEIYTLVVFLASVGFLRWYGMRIDGQTLRYTFDPFIRAAPGFLGLGIGMQLAVAAIRAVFARKPQPIVDYLKALTRPRWWLSWGRLFIAYGLTTYVYFWVKVSIPLINHARWDDLLWRLDRILHLGISPSIFAVELFNGSFLVGQIDHWYAVYITTVIWGIAFVSASANERLRTSFMASCCVLWTVGPWIYMAIPVLGPIYTAPDVWQPIQGQMPGAEAGQAMLWENYQKMIAGRTGPLTQFNPTRGIAALPSLHVGAHALFAFWCRRQFRPLFALAVVATLLTFFGSVLSGWHYAIDGYVAVLVALLSYALAIRFQSPEEPTMTDRETPDLTGPTAEAVTESE